MHCHLSLRATCLVVPWWKNTIQNPLLLPWEIPSNHRRRSNVKSVWMVEKCGRWRADPKARVDSTHTGFVQMFSDVLVSVGFLSRLDTHIQQPITTCGGGGGGQMGPTYHAMERQMQPRAHQAWVSRCPAENIPKESQSSGWQMMHR